LPIEQIEGDASQILQILKPGQLANFEKLTGGSNGSWYVAPHRSNGGVEQDVVDRSLIVMRDGSGLLRHGEDHVEIGRGQEFGSAVIETPY
jgi:hypothetical protein